MNEVLKTGERPPRHPDQAAESLLATPPTMPPMAPAAIAEALTLSQRERGRLLDMSDAVGVSPRRAKRFANLYLLFKASLSASERRDLERRGGLGRSYVAAMILLAGITGAPRATGRFLQALGAPPDSDEDAAQHLREMLAATKPEQKESAVFNTITVTLTGGGDDLVVLSHLRAWAPRVRRFLFDAPAP